MLENICFGWPITIFCTSICLMTLIHEDVKLAEIEKEEMTMMSFPLLILQLQAYCFAVTFKYFVITTSVPLSDALTSTSSISACIK